MTPPPAAPAFPDPIQTLVPYGSICTLSGATGVGKTAFLATVIAQLQRGEEIFGHATHTPPAIGVLACDRPWRDHVQWFVKAECGPLVSLSLRDIKGYNWEVLRDWRKVASVFGQLIDSMQLPPGSLLIVDPVSLFIPGRLVDYKDVAIGIGLLANVLEPRQLTMLGIFHVSKQKMGSQDTYQRPQDRILGSTALLGYSETAFYLLAPADAKKANYEFGYVCHQLPEATFAYKRDPLTGLFIPAEFLDLQQDEEVALSLLPDDHETVLARSIWIDKVTKVLSVNAQQAFAIIKRLWRAGRVEKVGRGLYRRAKPH